MVTWTRTIKALVAITALLICTQASPVPKTALVEKRMVASSNGMPGPRLTFDEVYSGVFQPDEGVRRPMASSSIPSFYGHMYFKDGAPIYVFANDASKVSKLDMVLALKTFGKFHAYNAATGRFVSIIPRSDSPTQSIQTLIHDIPAQMEQVAQTRQGFGPHVAVVAHGLPVSPKSKTILGFRKDSMPEWKKVFEAEPMPQNPVQGQHPEQFRKDLRMALDRNRHVRFVSSDGTRSLGLRARPDGSIEYQVKNLVGDLSHFHG